MRALIVGLASALAGAAIAAPSGSAGAAAESLESITREGASTWADREVGRFVGSGDVTAAGAVVVSGGKVLVARSYGWFDPVRRIPIDAHDQFLIGSITKSFVSLVIAKLAEEGRIRSLDDPANRYLRRYRLPGKLGGDVTIAQLATHSAGLDSPGYRLSSGEQRGIPATPEELRQWLPKIVRPPGFKVVYANYGPPILGALSEDITGERFDRLMSQEVLEPLGLRDTALSYDPTGGARLVYAGITGHGPIRYAMRMINDPLTAPAGSIQTTPGDMARYLNALLGHAPEALSSAVLQTERAPRAVNFPGLSPVGLGVFLDPWNGVTVVGHGGLIAGFRSSLQILPDRDVGVFVVFAGGHDAFNEGPGDPGAATDALLREILGAVRPLPPKRTSDPATFAGRYWLELRAHTTPESLLGADRLVDVIAAPDGGLLIGAPGTQKDEFTEVAPALYQGPMRDGRRPNLYGFETGRLLANKMYGVRVSGLGDPRTLIFASLPLLFLALTGLVQVLGRQRARWLGVMCGAAAAVCAYAIVLPQLLGVDLDIESFNGIGWRWRLATAAVWLLLLAGVAATAAGIRAAGARGQTGLRRLGAAHLAAVGAASVTVAAIGGFFHLL
jgi:CubicO group peptidase (beta-lactamase class C family)